MRAEVTSFFPGSDKFPVLINSLALKPKSHSLNGNSLGGGLYLFKFGTLSVSESQMLVLHRLEFPLLVPFKLLWVLSVTEHVSSLMLPIWSLNAPYNLNEQPLGILGKELSSKLD